MQISKLSSLQLELLKVYSFEPSNNEMEEIRRLLGSVFAKKLLKRVNENIGEKKITNEQLEKWLNEKS